MKKISYNPLKMPLSWTFCIVFGFLGYVVSQGLSEYTYKKPLLSFPINGFEALAKTFLFMIIGFFIGWGLNALWRKL